MLIENLLYKENIDKQAEIIEDKFLDFLKTYRLSTSASEFVFARTENAAPSKELFYEKQAQLIRSENKKSMLVNFQHLISYDIRNELREPITIDFVRFQPFINNAVTKFMKFLFNDWAKDKSFIAAFYNLPSTFKVRDLKSSHIGCLVSLTGTVTRTSEVRPELVHGAFKCKLCNTTIKRIDQQFRYTEPKICINRNCKNTENWELSTEESHFSDWQKLKVQENPSDIPPGSMPRSFDVILRDDMVEICKPGDKATFIGSLMVVPDILSLSKPGEKIQHSLKRDAVRKEEQKPNDGIKGLKQLGIKDMSYKMIFVALSVQFFDSKIDMYYNGLEQIEEDNENIMNQFSELELDKILEIKDMTEVYKKLSNCIAPNIFGNDEIKRGILLMLLGGVNKITHEGIKLRGDINVCIVGDPSTAKSQFLKYISTSIARSVYTSGKGSTAAGLTASVVKDPETGEFCIEAGAIMLADNGICCIDEFDKMDLKDQVAIHESMEQQTISIAKAGIQATLMARTSILAACNPLRGRYDKSKTLKANLDISAPIMSRFDLFFVIVDEINVYNDFRLAQHIIDLHMKEEVDSIMEEISQNDFKTYIKFAKRLKPKFTKEAAEKLRESYIQLRQDDIGLTGSLQKSSYRITVRQLESLIRLSESIARAHLDELIHPIYVMEATRLLKKSIIPVEVEDVEINYFKNYKVDRNKVVPLSKKEEKEREEHKINKTQMDLDESMEKLKIDHTMKMKGEEYEELKEMIIFIVKEYEKECKFNYSNISLDESSITQLKIIETIVERKIDLIDDKEKAEHMINLINSVINNLYEKEGILILVEDNEDEDKREFTLNINYG